MPVATDAQWKSEGDGHIGQQCGSRDKRVRPFKGHGHEGGVEQRRQRRIRFAPDIRTTVL